VLEEKIDYTLLDTCPKAIMDKLKTQLITILKFIKLGVGAITMTTGTMKDIILQKLLEF
jgi:hypothetical protein